MLEGLKTHPMEIHLHLHWIFTPWIHTFHQRQYCPQFPIQFLVSMLLIFIEKMIQ
jgi:hypothetical protein